MSTNTEDQLEFDLGEGEEETEVSLGTKRPQKMWAVKNSPRILSLRTGMS